jgi:hypothetical protein
MVIQQIETSILNPDHFIELSESLYKLYIEQFSSYTQDIEDAEARLAAIKKETDNLMDLVVSGFQKERCIAKLGELEVEEKALTHRLSDIATAMKSQYTQDDFLDFLHDMHRRLKSGDPEDYRYVLDALIHRITIYGDKVDIELEVNFGYAGSRKSYHASSEIKRPYRARALV